MQILYKVHYDLSYVLRYIEKIRSFNIFSRNTTQTESKMYQKCVLIKVMNYKKYNDNIV